MDITAVFYSLVDVFTSIIFWMQTHGFIFVGKFYSFFEIEMFGEIIIPHFDLIVNNIDKLMFEMFECLKVYLRRSTNLVGEGSPLPKALT